MNEVSRLRASRIRLGLIAEGFGELVGDEDLDRDMGTRASSAAAVSLASFGKAGR
jgi:hypothetical protein